MSSSSSSLCRRKRSRVFLFFLQKKRLFVWTKKKTFLWLNLYIFIFILIFPSSYSGISLLLFFAKQYRREREICRRRERKKGGLGSETCGVWSWITTIFVSNTFFRDWMRRMWNSCTEWIVKRESWLRDPLAQVIWKRGLKLNRCRRFRLWSLLGSINRCGRVGGFRHLSALELLTRINSSCSSGCERRKSVIGIQGRLIWPQNKVIWKW